jgi:hypothetical protein
MLPLTMCSAGPEMRSFGPRSESVLQGDPFFENGLY